MAKQAHCVPTWATPSDAAKQLNPPMPLVQQPSTPHERIRMLKKAQVPDVTPNSKKRGLIPSEVPRCTMRMCWGRYDI